jgi:hypothetical protein
MILKFFEGLCRIYGDRGHCPGAGIAAAVLDDFVDSSSW